MSLGRGNELWTGVGAGERTTGMRLEEIVLELEIAGLAGLRLLPGEVGLAELLRDPAVWLTPGTQARVGAALRAAGEILEESSKGCVQGGGSYEDRGVKFEWVDPSYGVVEERVREEYPYSEWPELYRAPAVDAEEVGRRYPRSERPELYELADLGRVMVGRLAGSRSGNEDGNEDGD